MLGSPTGLKSQVVRGLRRADRQLRGIGWQVVIVSGYRSPGRQAELLARWEAGDRAGLTSKPLVYSQHTLGRAVDASFAPLGGNPLPASEIAPAWFLWLARTSGLCWAGPGSNHLEMCE